MSQHTSPPPLPSVLEGLLFASGKPLSFSRMASLTGASKKEIVDIVGRMQEEYQKLQRGIRLVITEKAAQLVSAPEHAEVVAQLLGKDLQGELSEAAAETLAIVAYRAPMTRPEIEAVRGVSCTYTLRQLVLRGLLEAAPSEDDKRLMAYTPTLELLQELGLSSLEELPDYAELSKGVGLVTKQHGDETNITADATA